MPYKSSPSMGEDLDGGEIEAILSSLCKSRMTDVVVCQAAQAVMKLF